MGNAPINKGAQKYERFSGRGFARVGDLSHAETRRGGEFFSRKERKDHKAGGPTSVSATIDRPGWKRVRLGEVCKPCRGVRVIRSQLSQGRYLVYQNSLIPLGHYDKCNTPANTTFVIGAGSAGEIGYCDEPFWAADDCFFLLPNENVISKFLYYSLTAQQKHISGLVRRGSVPRLARDIVGNLVLTLPDMAEQEKIVRSLTAIDINISTIQSLVAKYEAIKKATVNLLLKPTGTHMVKLGEVADISRGGSPRPIQDYITADIDGINWIKIGDVSVDAKYIKQTEERIKPTGVAMSRQVKAGDFILSNSMSFGRPYILKIDGCIHDGWLAIQNYQNTFDVDYLYYLLGSDMVFAQYIENAAGSSVKNLNKDIVAKITLPSPPLSEQCKIAEQITAIDNVLADYKAQLEKARQLKAGMMSYFFG